VREDGEVLVDHGRVVFEEEVGGVLVDEVAQTGVGERLVVEVEVEEGRAE